MTATADSPVHQIPDQRKKEIKNIMYDMAVATYILFMSYIYKT